MVAAMLSCRTLVVEDDREACEVLTKVLTLLGHQVDCARTIHQALRQCKTFAPTHVLLDLMLPDGSGAELLAFIRDNKLPIKVALVTAAGPGQYWDEAMRHAPDAVFRKPWDLNQLKAWLAMGQRG